MLQQPCEWYTRWRLRHVLPQGTPDFEADRSLLLDHNADQLNGIDWQKGCYLGQEVTARMKHRHKNRYHLCHIMFAAESPVPPTETPLCIDGVVVGTLRHACGRDGLAKIKTDADTNHAVWHYQPSDEVLVPATAAAVSSSFSL